MICELSSVDIYQIRMAVFSAAIGATILNILLFAMIIFIRRGIEDAEQGEEAKEHNKLRWNMSSDQAKGFAQGRDSRDDEVDQLKQGKTHE